MFIGFSALNSLSLVERMSYLWIQGMYLSHERFIYCFERERKEGECLSCTDHCLTLIQNNQYATEAHFGYPGPQHCENKVPGRIKLPVLAVA